MSKGHSLEVHSDFIAVSLKLDMRPGGLPDRLKELASACAEYNCRRILGRVEGQLSDLTVADVFEMASYLAGTAPSLQIAIVTSETDSEGREEFFKLAASNRGLTIDFFTDESQALLWLGV